jgi:acetamidase/formamidase
VEEIEIGKYGWTASFESIGSVSEKKCRFLAIWEMCHDTESKSMTSKEIPNVRLTIEPFCGMMGVAMAEEGDFSNIPPRSNGGNLDIKYLTQGSRLFLPIFVEGALFSIGDVHAAQGDGEICTTAIETSAEVKLRFSIAKGSSIPEPRFETKTHFAVTAFSDLVDKALNKATNYMIDFLISESDLDREQARALCSVAADLKVFEIVDSPHVLVGMMISKEILSNLRRRSA